MGIDDKHTLAPVHIDLEDVPVKFVYDYTHAHIVDKQFFSLHLKCICKKTTKLSIWGCIWYFTMHWNTGSYIFYQAFTTFRILMEQKKNKLKPFCEMVGGFFYNSPKNIQQRFDLGFYFGFNLKSKNYVWHGCERINYFCANFDIHIHDKRIADLSRTYLVNEL